MEHVPIGQDRCEKEARYKEVLDIFMERRTKTQRNKGKSAKALGIKSCPQELRPQINILYLSMFSLLSI